MPLRWVRTNEAKKPPPAREGGFSCFSGYGRQSTACPAHAARATARGSSQSSMPFAVHAEGKKPQYHGHAARFLPWDSM